MQEKEWCRDRDTSFVLFLKKKTSVVTIGF